MIYLNKCYKEVSNFMNKADKVNSKNKIEVKNNILTLNKIGNYESIVKSNNLVRGSYTVTANEQKFLYKIFEYIQENKYETNKIVFEFDNMLREFKDVINKNLTKKQFWNMLKGLQKKHPDIIINGKYVSTQWYRLIGELDYSVVTLELDEYIFKYVQSQKSNFSKLLKSSVYNFKTFYAMKIYEFIRSWANLKKSEYITLDRFKVELDIHEKASYKNNFANIRRRILDPSVKEINEISEFVIAYEYSKNGKQVTGLNFYIRENKEKENNVNDAIELIKNGEGDKLTERELQSLLDDKIVNDENVKLEILTLLADKIRSRQNIVDVDYEDFEDNENSHEDKASIKEDKKINIDNLSIEELEELVKDESLDKEYKKMVEDKLEELVAVDILNFLSDEEDVTKNKFNKKKDKPITMAEKYKAVGNPYDSDFDNEIYDKFIDYCFEEKISFIEDEVMRRILSESIAITFKKIGSDKIQDSCYAYFTTVFKHMIKERYKKYKEDEEFKIRKEFHYSKKDNSEEVMKDMARDFY